MQTPPAPLPSLPELLAQLKAALQAGHRALAAQLQQAILQRLASEAAAQQAIEREVRALMAAPPAAPAPPVPIRFTLEDLRADRGSESGDADGAAAPYDDPAEAASPAPPAVPVPPEGILYPVWFGTNRRPTADGRRFGAERADQVSRGRVDVHVPEAHRFGETGSSFWDKLMRLDFRDDQLRVEKVTPQARDAFFADINHAVAAARASGDTPQALFFLHGYNNTFEDAALRAAQIGCDLKVGGATAFFSWPSGGTAAAYPADEAAIEGSEQAITDFLVDFTQSCGADKIHLIAHSMGNRGLLRALQRIAGNAETQGKVKFGQIFLAAPDVDRDLFLSLAALYPACSERTTLYASHRDLPVYLSSQFHQAARAGYFEPYTVAPHIDTVAVPNFNVDWLGHGYFAQAEALLHDIYDLMRHNENPAQRQRIENVPYAGGSFWRFER